MAEWKEYKLGDVCSIVGRIGFRGYTTEDLTSNPKDGAISLSPTNIVAGELDLSKPTYIKWPKYYESPEIMLEQGDIVLVKTGSSIGRTTRIREIKHPMTLNPQFVVLKKIKVDSVFLSYIIKSPYFQASLRTITVGSAIPTLSQKNLAKLTINLPNIQVQKEIASILSSLDDKIEVNRRINENLEQQAQALFKSWFVDFEPFKDGEFVESELGMIPKGWRVGKLGDLVDIIKPSIKPQGNLVYSHYSIPAFDESQIPSSDIGETIKSNKFSIQDSVTLLSKLNPEHKRIWYVNKVEANAICSTEFLPFYAKNREQSAFVYCYLNSSYIYREIANGARGTTNSHQRIDAKAILSRDLAYNNKVISLFCNIVGSILEQRCHASQESRRLASLRDTLLPRLMSGELKINDIGDSL